MAATPIDEKSQTPTMAAAEKRAQVAEMLTAEVVRVLQPCIAQIQNSVDKNTEAVGKSAAAMTQALGALVVELRMQQQSEKRPMKTSSSRRAATTAAAAHGAARPGAGAITTESAVESMAHRVKNAMLFCRFARAHAPDLIERFYTPGVVNKMVTAETVQNKPEGSNVRKMAEGVFLWKSGLDSTQQIEMRNIFKIWKDARSTAEMADHPQCAPERVPVPAPVPAPAPAPAPALSAPPALPAPAPGAMPTKETVHLDMDAILYP